MDGNKKKYKDNRPPYVHSIRTGQTSLQNKQPKIETHTISSSCYRPIFSELKNQITKQRSIVYVYEKNQWFGKNKTTKQMNEIRATAFLPLKSSITRFIITHLCISFIQCVMDYVSWSVGILDNNDQQKTNEK